MRVVLPLALEDNSIDTCICDPPYGYDFMGKDWDHGVPGVQFWREVKRVLKPGATLMAFGGTRTHHRLMCAIEDAGFELRDVMMWVYGSGYPKSHDISKAMDKAAGAEREVVGVSPHSANRKAGAIWGGTDEEPERPITAPATPEAQRWDGWGTALKPAWEPIVVAMKPRDGTFVNNALTWGVAGIWVDGGRVPTNGEHPSSRNGQGYKERGEIYGGGNGLPDHEDYEPHSEGRWPANLIHDGSDEVVGLFPETGGDTAHCRNPNGRTNHNKNVYGEHKPQPGEVSGYNDNGGSAARFFYCAKASRSERNAGCDELEDVDGGHYRQDQWSREHMGNTPDAERNPVKNNHPTVKPVEVLRYLCRLTKTPTGGVVLDPFMGSGSTGIAAVKEGREFIGVELRADYLEIARARIEWVLRQPRQLRLFQ